MVITGDDGKVRVGHQEVAVITKWCLSRDSDTLNQTYSTLTARVVSSTFWLSQPFIFQMGLWMGDVWWVWGNAHVKTADTRNIELLVAGNPVAIHNF